MRMSGWQARCSFRTKWAHPRRSQKSFQADPPRSPQLPLISLSLKHYAAYYDMLRKGYRFALVMEDDAGPDEKIIAVPTSKLTRRYENIRSYSDLPEITIQQIEHFFQHYKDLEPDKWVEITSVEQVDVAKKMIMEAIERGQAAS